MPWFSLLALLAVGFVVIFVAALAALLAWKVVL